MKLVPVVYSECGHGLNILGGAEADPTESILQEFERTGQPVKVDWNEGKCWLCNGTWDKRPAIVNPTSKKYLEEL